MRILKPNAKTGIFTPTITTPKMTGVAYPLARPSPALFNLDKIINGEPPAICLSRKQGGIGDVLMTLPTVKAVSKKYNCKIDYATDLQYLEGALGKVLQGNPHINRVLSYHDINVEEYAAVLNLTCPCVVHEQPHAKPINRIDLFARHARIPLTDFSIDYYITEEEHLWAQELLSKIPSFKKKVLVQPFSSTPRRDAPVEIMKRTLREMSTRQRNIVYIVFTHSADRDTRTVWGDTAEVIHLKDYDVRKIAAIMHYCDLVICPDSAILHLAGALDKPTVTLFGPTDAKARVDHYPRAIAVAPGEELHCYPCWYSNNCNNKNLCWKRLDPVEIANVALAVLNNQQIPKTKSLVHFGSLYFINDFTGEVI